MKWWKDERGSVGVIFALSLIPVIGMMGLAIDSIRIYRTKQRLLGAFDAASIAGAMHYRDTGDQDAAKAIANTYLDNNLKGWKLTTTRTWTIDSDKIAMAGTGYVILPMSFGAIFIKEMKVGADSIAQAAGKKLELSVMLDTTGSMDETSGKGDRTSKLADLKAAMGDMLKLFKLSLEKDMAKIGIAPFSEGVFVGGDAELLRGKQSATKKVGGTTYKLTTCVAERTGNSRYDDTFGNLQPLYNEAGTCEEKSKVLPLTSSITKLQTHLDDMVAKGGTAGHLGTAWAWYLLSPSWAGHFGTSVVNYGDKKTVKAAVLMTDGEFNLQYCDGLSDKIKQNCSAVNSATQAESLCKEMKAKEIIVYFIGFDVDTESAKAMGRKCATDLGKYFVAYDSDSLKSAFVMIGKELLDQVKLTK